MKFGPVPPAAAEGAILAHSVRHPGGVLHKGIVLSADDVDALQAARIAEVTVARLDLDDIHEDEAAGRVAAAIAGGGLRVEAPYTGRSNLYAEPAGVVVIDRDAVDRLNRIDPAITIATLPEYAGVEPGRMVATVKIIPFAVARDKVAAAQAIGPVLRVAAYRPLKVGLVASTLPSLKSSVLDKTRALLDERLAPAGARITREMRTAHDAGAVAAGLAALKREGNDLLIAFGASATVDPGDVVPAAIEKAGGTLTHLGMPVDPGNLLVLGDLDGTPVVGAPGCARSPKENGFDWILNRLLAGLAVTPEDVTGLGVGGLLMEIVSRPQPREASQRKIDKSVAALILAAGQSSRMGGPNKLLATISGKPLVRIAAEQALRSHATSVTLVTGHQDEEVRAALAGLPVKFVHNPAFAGGLSTSLRTGVSALPRDAAAAVIVLADMPGITSATIDRLIEAFDPEVGTLITLPTFNGKRGNPVLWSRRFFPDLMNVAGDTGGRHLIGANADAVVELELGPAVTLDIDTPAELEAAGGRPVGT